MPLSWFRPFRAAAIIAVRNERHTIGRCLQHLAEQGMEVYIIDNESNDGTSDIIASHMDRTAVRCIQHPFPGYYDWDGLLRIKETLAREIHADWIMHLDADEIPESPFPGKTLAEAFRTVGQQGYNAVNFNEFVFVPSSENEDWTGRDYVAGMKRYYFFEPHPQRLVRAWKRKRKRVDLASSGGHDIQFPGRRIYPQAFALRHYIALSLDQFRSKYRERVFAPHEVARGWHYNRVHIGESHICLPDPARLHTCHEDGTWDTSTPWKTHFFEPAT